MIRHTPPDPDAPRVMLLAAVLYADEASLEAGLRRLETAFAPLAWRGPAHAFDLTDYYAEEMGRGLQRVLVAFRGLVPPGFLVEAKWRAAGVEDALRRGGRRRVNVDVGYLDEFKLVLASFKGRGNKLYLARGVWADMTLTYGRGRFEPLPWSFPDFRDGRYDADLRAIRERYKAALRAGAAREGGGR